MENRDGLPETPYHPVVLHLIPRILTNVDRDPDSPTYGCFDRSYWHYKVHDYSSGLLQQSMLTLALVYDNNFNGNVYYKKAEIRDFAIAGLEFCTRIQHNDGSFDEYWAGEHSIPSTAFTLYAICETSDVLGYITDDIKRCIDRSVRFLENNVEQGALNQEMAAIAGIRYAATILDDDRIRDISTNRFTQFLEKQTNEGWFPEYGGFDFSYSTVTLDYLIRFYELSKEERTLESAKRLLNVLKYFVHPDGSVGGEYGTRNTEYFLPHGIEYLRKDSAIADKFISKILEYIVGNNYLNLSWDERYILHYVSHSFVKALLIHKEYDYCHKDQLPCETTFNHFLSEAQIYIHSNRNYYFIANLSKGGLFKAICKKTMETSTDCAFRISYKGDLYVAEWPKNNEYTLMPNGFMIKAIFAKTNFMQQSTLKLLLLRLSSKILGARARKLTKNALLFGKKDIEDMTLCRTISFDDEKIIIEDTIDVGEREVTARLIPGLSVRYIPSSRFYQINTLNTKIKSELTKVKGKTSFKRELTFGQ